MTTAVAFGRRLRELRREHGVSQYVLARRTDLHTTAIGRFERGEREPRLKSILRLADGLGVPPGALVNDLVAPRGATILPMADFSQLAHRVVQATIDATEPGEPAPADPQTPAQVNGRNGGLKGGKARAAKLTPEERSEIARNAARARWQKSSPA